MPKKTKTIARSSKTGKFVSKAYAKTHKSTTTTGTPPRAEGKEGAVC